MERMVDVVIGLVIGWRHDIGSKNNIFDSQKEILHRGKTFHSFFSTNFNGVFIRLGVCD